MALDSAVCRVSVVDIRKYESRNNLRREKESNVDAILEGKPKEGMGLNLNRKATLVWSFFICPTKMKRLTNQFKKLGC